MIPASLLSHTLNFDPDDDKSGTVSVPRNVLLFLLKAYLAQQPFDEAAYLQANPDVALAVQEGRFESGKDHFLQRGYWEERAVNGTQFCEEWYLQQNPDVAIAVQLGDWPSGQAHYRAYGKREWRSPTPDLQSDFEGWRHLFMPPSAPSTR